MSDARALQKLIHVGCRELGLDADTRHDLQLQATGKASLRDMSAHDLGKVLKVLEQKGFKRRAGKPMRPKAPRADLRLVHVLWRLLGEAGVLKRPGRDGLNAFVRARFEKTWGSVPLDVDALRDWEKIDAIIQALLAWCDRAGVEVNHVERGR